MMPTSLFVFGCVTVIALYSGCNAYPQSAWIKVLNKCNTQQLGTIFPLDCALPPQTCYNLCKNKVDPDFTYTCWKGWSLAVNDSVAETNFIYDGDLIGSVSYGTRTCEVPLCEEVWAKGFGVVEMERYCCCLPEPKPKAECGFLQVQTGTHIQSGTPSGMTVTVECYPHYQATPATVTCTDGVWSSDSVNCTVATCGALTLANGDDIPDGTKHSETVNINCDVGAVANPANITCIDGAWSPATVVCEVNENDLLCSVIGNYCPGETVANNCTLAGDLCNQASDEMEGVAASFCGKECL